MNLDRRQLLIGGTALASFAAWPASGALAHGRMMLLDPALAKADRERAMLMASGEVRHLGPDLVRQWRDGLDHAVATQGAVAYVRWDKALLLRDLAREQRLAITQKRLSKSLFAINLG